ncbi:cytochrome P450 [Streptomyces sp. NBC_00564]|uniref:cytochrome P450 family protein n=1 Tax=Streptomyces sp. NBC_00564 TaxID=2903663 RepID=UPI00352BD615|nr:cytochrome P450 [Streptomyces sp. NBC_00564]
MTTSNLPGGDHDEAREGGSLRAVLEGAPFQADPHAVLRQLTDSGAAHRCEPDGAPPQLLVTGYEAARQVLTDPRVSKRSERAGLEPGWLMSGVRDEVGVDYMLTVDPPEHTRLRKLVARAFTSQKIDALRPRTREIAGRLADDVLAQETPELIDGFASRVPIAVICELLGVPLGDWDRFRWASEQIVSPVAGGDREEAYVWMSGYLAELIAGKRADPGQDLLSGLATDTADDRLTDAEMVGMAFLLLIAGYETTANLIGAVLHGLARQPELLKALRADPGLVPTVVEEFLRLDGPVLTATERFATEDMQVGDVPVRRGDMLLVSLAAANRDPARFEEPDSFRPGRSAGHVAFGYGVHYCLGAPLARMEAEVAITTFVQRVEGLTLAVDEADLEWSPGLLMHGVRRLPVSAVVSGAPHDR